MEGGGGAEEEDGEVDFRAWNFAGSEKLWAGLVIHLTKPCTLMPGICPIRLYRVTRHPFLMSIKSQNRACWRMMKVCGVLLWLASAVVTTIRVVLCILLYSSGFQVRTNETLSGLSGLESVAIVTLDPSADMALQFEYRQYLRYSQGQYHQGQGEQVGDQMRFMSNVRKEVSILIDLIHFMEVLEDRKMWVVLEITNLELVQTVQTKLFRPWWPATSC